MKNNYNILVIALALIICNQLSFSQNTNKGWSFEAGLSAVDLFPVGENMPQGEYFDEFFNLNDHWNLGVYLGVTRNFTNNLSFTAKGTINEISKWGEFGEVDESVLVDNLKYYGLDGMLNYSFGKGKLKPFVAAGGGYTWIEEGAFNTFSNRSGINNHVGAGTVNGSLGFKYWMNSRFGINLQTTYKHAFKDYLPSHWDHNLGVVYKLENTEYNGLENRTLTDEKGLWSFEAGLSAVDLFPVGENAPQGDYFDEFLNLNDHWNLGVYFGATRNLTNNLSVSAKGTINEISKWGQFGNVDESVLVDNLKYYGLDGMVNYSIGQAKLQPFVAIGGGYTWIEEGTFNTFSNRNGVNNHVGAGTVNGSVGVKYWVTNQVGVNLQTTYKHAFKDYLPSHWDHNIGVVYRPGKVNGVLEEEVSLVEEVSNDRDGDGVPNNFDLCPDTAGLTNLGGCPDTDGDGVIDKDDLCPKVKGSFAFGGCADSDNDGVPDNRDKCPDVKGADNGCPIKITETKTTTTVNPFIGERKIYFDYNSSKLDLNAKEILDDIATNIPNNSSYNISILGHADSRGNNEYNYNLSLKRAEEIKNYLASKNLTNSSISISGKGDNLPAASNSTDSGRALNRRAELTINISAN